MERPAGIMAHSYAHDIWRKTVVALYRADTLNHSVVTTWLGFSGSGLPDSHFGVREIVF